MKNSDFALIRRTLDGDQNAFTTLVTKYQKWVHTLVWRKIGDFHIAEEITQDVFLKVYKKLSTLKPSDHFTGWLYVIATRRCIAWFRKKRLPMTSLDATPVSELEEFCYTQYETERSEQISLERQRDIVKRLLEKLPESERTVVTLHYLAEMSCEKISEFLGVSPNTVKSRLHRARKRLKKQEHLLHDVSGIFQVPPTLTENIMREIANVKPTSPSVNKPWIPWGLSFAATFLVILMMGFGTLALSRFQQPYSLDATSEMTVELVDAPVVLELERKSDALTQFGKADALSKNGGNGFQAEPLLIAAAQADETDLPAAKPQWIQTKGPGGVLSAGLFLTSDQTLYAITKTGLYRLTEERDAWTLISASGPNRGFEPVMAERNDTLYLLTPNELLASTDAGKTWNTLGTRPEGRAVALVITDAAMYLILKTEVFRSEDVGKPWEPIGEPLRALALQGLADNKLEEVRPDASAPGDFFAIQNMVFRIWDALAIDNILFMGTSQGLFRLTDAWEKLPVPTLDGIKSLAAIEARLYVGTILPHGLPPELGPEPQASTTVFASTDLGDSWTNITPISRGHSIRVAEVVTVGNTLILTGYGLRSQDGGETWITLGGDLNRISVSPAVALDENNLYTSGIGIRRSTDGGLTWHPFMTGIVNSRVPNLFIFKNVLYALTPTKMLKSADGGESWESVDLIGANEKTSRPVFPPFLRGKGFNAFTTKLATANDVLYVSNSEPDDVTLFYLSDADNAFLPVEDAPDFEEDTLYTEWEEKRNAAIRSRYRPDMERVMNQRNAAQERIYEEQETNGTFTAADDAVFMEYRHKLYRWQFDETGWHDTGLEDHAEISPIGRKGLALAVSGNTVYAGKREGELFLSLDNGDTWRDVTANLVLPFGHFKEIVFAGSTVYVSTDMGVMRSNDGETWHVVTDTDRNSIIMDQIAVNGMTAYGVCDSGIYQVDNQTNTWEQIIPELPHTAISFAIDGDMFYIGTKQNGVLRFQRDRQ